jgi:hypothetical protein
MPPYPRWRYFPRSPPPVWVAPLVEVFARARAEIDSAVEHAKRMESDEVLRSITSGLSVLGFAIEQARRGRRNCPAGVLRG